MSLYGTCYRAVLWPVYEAVRRRKTWNHWRAAEQRQWWSAEQIAEFQFAELRRLVDHAYQHSAWYRKRWQTLGMTPDQIQKLDDFRRLPLVSKEDIRQHAEEMLADNFAALAYEHRTGGSTGVPLRFFLHRSSYEWRLAVSMRGYRWAGCEDGERQFYVWGQPIGAPPLLQRLKVSFHNAVLRRRVVSSFQFGEAQIQECLRQLNAFRPRVVVGYTSALCLLAKHILETNAPVVALQGIITAAESVSRVQRDLIEQAFHAPVFASYGSREFMLIGMECEKHHGLHLSADNLLVEVLRPDGAPVANGELGEIVVTDLHNYALPFLRYRIGDLGVMSNRACACGRGLPLLDRVEGRILDVIRTPDGRIVPGEFFPHLLKEFDAIHQFQVVQKQLDCLILKLVLRPGEHKEQLRRLDQELRRVLGSHIMVQIETVANIPLTPSGKFRVTVSELSPP